MWQTGKRLWFTGNVTLKSRKCHLPIGEALNKTNTCQRCFSLIVMFTYLRRHVTRCGILMHRHLCWEDHVNWVCFEKPCSVIKMKHFTSNLVIVRPFCHCDLSPRWQWWHDIKRLDKFSNPLSKASALLLCDTLAMSYEQTHFQSRPSSPRGNKCTNVLFQPCDVMWSDRNCSHNLLVIEVTP